MHVENSSHISSSLPPSRTTEHHLPGRHSLLCRPLRTPPPCKNYTCSNSLLLIPCPSSLHASRIARVKADKTAIPHSSLSGAQTEGCDGRLLLLLSPTSLSLLSTITWSPRCDESLLPLRSSSLAVKPSIGEGSRCHFVSVQVMWRSPPLVKCVLLPPVCTAMTSLTSYMISLAT